MKIIALASQKGGVGKTTLAGHLSVEASKDPAEHVAILDTDPQGSLAAWWNVRKAETPIFIGADINNLSEQIEELKKQNVSMLFIDTPPAITASIKKVIDIADLVIIPTRPSPHDLRAVAGTVDLVDESNKKPPMIFIINGASIRAKITSQAAIALSQHGRVAPINIHHRIDFASSMTDGRTVSEIDDTSKSAQEIKGLWEYIRKLISK